MFQSPQEMVEQQNYLFMVQPRPVRILYINTATKAPPNYPSQCRRLLQKTQNEHIAHVPGVQRQAKRDIQENQMPQQLQLDSNSFTTND